MADITLKKIALDFHSYNVMFEAATIIFMKLTSGKKHEELRL